MNKLLIATTNVGKLAEFRNFFSDLPLKILSLQDVGITDDVKEDGKTYTENSQKKALFYAQKSNLPSISDDGGLEIAALDGAPGIRSRRWLGYEATDEELIEHTKKIAKELPENNRKASFVTVVSFAMPNGMVWSEEGKVDGIIAKEPLMKLLKGYPYRSFFYLPELSKYYHESELTPQEMKDYNHRYKAVEKLKLRVREALGL